MQQDAERFSIVFVESEWLKYTERICDPEQYYVGERKCVHLPVWFSEFNIVRIRIC